MLTLPLPWICAVGFRCITVTVITVTVSLCIFLPGTGARIACGLLTKPYRLAPVVMLERVVAVAVQKANTTVV